MSSEDAQGIPFYDTEGRRHVVSRDYFACTILPDQFEQADDDADRLYGVIVIALTDGFFAEALEPARHLFVIDPDEERATNVLGIALMRTGGLDEAEKLYQEYLAKECPSGVIFTNLAKIYSSRGEDARAERTLWTALQVDPNQDAGLKWWGAIHRERGGDQGYWEAMRSVAELPGSWRAQLWLARKQLSEGDSAGAVATYREVLPAAVIDGEALTMISGDLGDHGCSRDSLDLVGPVYDPVTHGPYPGLNLIQACIETGDKARGRELLGSVESLRRYDLVESLDMLRELLD